MDPNTLWSKATNPTTKVEERLEAIVALHEHVTSGGRLPDGVTRPEVVAQRVQNSRLIYQGTPT